jgi:hypothetical protein
VHGDIFDEVVRLVIVAILGVFSFFFRRLIRDLDTARNDLQIHRENNRRDFKEVNEKLIKLDKRLAIITERDRLRRLEDYERDPDD